MLRTVIRVAATLTLLLVVYALLPRTEKTWVRTLIFSIVIAALAILVVDDARSILRAVHPTLRAVEVLVSVASVYIVAFSITYLGMSRSSANTFSERLNHASALYFTVVTFSTVGYGDIAAKTNAARLVVTAQILLNIVFLGVVVWVILGAVQRRLGRT